MGDKRNHAMLIEIRCDKSVGVIEADKRFQLWIDAYGHTTRMFSFQFVNVGHATRRGHRQAINRSAQ